MATNKTTWSDISAIFGINPLTGDIPLVTDINAVKFAMKCLVLTNYYERPFHSEIGSPISRMLFENITDVLIITLRQGLANLINTYEPRVNLIDIIVIPSPDNNFIYITIYFSLKNTTKQLQLDIALERTR
jgi:phage baseplate assembly protein W